MATPTSVERNTVDITAAPRAVLRESVRLLYRVLGERRLRTAQGNAWEAVLADRENARWRAVNAARLVSAPASAAQRSLARTRDERHSVTV